jgi:hypothetical protein
MLPYCYFAYRRSGKGIALTVIALATSMFWFPAPAQHDPRAIEMLEAEREYLLGAWTLWKVAIALLIPAGLGALALAFWKRSIMNQRHGTSQIVRQARRIGQLGQWQHPLACALRKLICLHVCACLRPITAAL